jgi:uncharacterized protein (TIGR02646 family)
MRAITRLPLPAEAAEFLDACQQSGATWDNAVQRVGFAPVRRTLAAMSGKHQSCMYCERSAATDVEHFKPQAKFPNDTFHWLNLLYCCTACNRHKSDQFPVDTSGAALLIDPSLDDPWQHLTFDTETGNIDPVFDLALGDYSPKGLATTTVLKLNRLRALQAAYLGSYTRLERVMSSDANCTPEALVAKLIDADDHGLLGWCFSPQGKRQTPFDRLTDSHLHIWLSLTRPEEPPCPLGIPPTS